jgi:L-aspartate oxidase
MTEHAGVLRSDAGLAEAERELSEIARTTGARPDTRSWEATNLLTVATVLVEAARMRQETRGSHWREDFPDADDERWSGHVDARLGAGRLELDYVPSARVSVDAPAAPPGETP